MDRHILFVGGGTAGHISPLLAVMEAVQQTPGVVCSYVGTAADLVNPLICESHLSFTPYSIPAGKLNRFFTLKQLTQPFLVAAGLVQAFRLLKRLKPDIIFSKGGYVSVPVALAAKRLKIPVISHETDVILGMANQIIARSAEKICTAFPVEAYSMLPAEKLVYTGQPVREVFRHKKTGSLAIQGRELDGASPLVTVIGGSQGAHRLNELIQALWPRFLENVQLVHICGPADYAELQEKAAALPSHLKKNLWLSPFLTTEIPTLFQRSTLVISRAGGTIGELAASHAAVLLVPLSTSSQGHQAANAAVLEKAGAAMIFDEEGTAESFDKLIKGLMHSDERLEELKRKIALFDIPDSSKKIAALLT